MTYQGTACAYSPVLYPWRVSQSTFAAIYILQYNCTAGGRCEWRPDRARSWLQCKRAFFVPLKECLMKFMRMSCPLSHTSLCKSRHRNPVCLHWNQNQEYEADSSCAEIQNLSIKYCRYLCEYWYLQHYLGCVQYCSLGGVHNMASQRRDARALSKLNIFLMQLGSNNN